MGFLVIIISFVSLSCSFTRISKINNVLPSRYRSPLTFSNYNSPNNNFPNNDVYEVNLMFDNRSKLVYSPSQDMYITSNSPSDASSSSSNSNSYLKSLFLPEGVTPDYYRFIKWRIVQRYISSILHVIGTRSLLLGLTNSAPVLAASGSTTKGLSVAAAVNWILKDVLGKLVRMFWAGKMGRKFDSDAKRWRFRGTIMYGLGNGLEIVCWLNPALFLFWATAANCLKQMSMLTSSSTRNAIYNSFMGGGRENIGDITAKGEAQIAVVDLVGILSGVLVMKIVKTDIKLVMLTYVTLQLMEIFCTYHEIRSVVFKLLNFERLWVIVDNIVGVENMLEQPQPQPQPQSTQQSQSSDLYWDGEVEIPNPYQTSLTEKVFMPPTHFCRRAIAFGSLGRAKLSPAELSSLLEIFSDDRYLLVVGEDVKNKHHNQRIKRAKKSFERLSSSSSEEYDDDDDDDCEYDSDNDLNLKSDLVASAQEDCHIVLHTTATNLDIVKATIALACLRRELGWGCVSGYDDDCVIALSRRSEDSYEQILEAKKEADELFPIVLAKLKDSGWSINRFMFGRVSMRADWNLANANFENNNNS